MRDQARPVQGGPVHGEPARQVRSDVVGRSGPLVYHNAFPAKFDTVEAGKIHAYFTKMLLAVSSEIEEIGGATTMDALHDAADAGLVRRASASGPVNTLRDEILVFAERKEQEYRKKWFPDRGELVTLEGIGNNVRQGAELFAKTAWLTQLSQETAGA